jgi:hypothetical protein
LRSASLWIFNIEKSTYNVPLGFGIGKVVKSGRTVFNMFVEPQFTIFHDGVGQPELQIFAALNMQFLPKYLRHPHRRLRDARSTHPPRARGARRAA